MIRFLCLALVFLAALSARAAAAQTAAPPVELGIDVSALLVPDRAGLAGGPRLVMNFDGRNAVEVTASLQPLSQLDAMAQQKTDLYLAAFKRVVRAAGSTRTFVTLGGGVERTLITVPTITLPGPPPVIFPSSSAREVRPAFTIGGGVDVRVSRRAAIVLESSFVLTDRFSGRLAAGLLLPIGAYPSEPGRLAASVPWAGLADGDRAWVTTGDGREIAGEVVRRSASRLELRTPRGLVAFDAAEVRAIDRTDPIRNGLVLGAIVGGVGAVVPSLLVTYLACALEEECTGAEAVAINAAFIGAGLGIGAATGALADSLHERRTSLYRRGGTASLSVLPVLQKRGVGIGAALRW